MVSGCLGTIKNLRAVRLDTEAKQMSQKKAISSYFHMIAKQIIFHMIPKQTDLKKMITNIFIQLTQITGANTAVSRPF